jgi:plastocyanin
MRSRHPLLSGLLLTTALLTAALLAAALLAGCAAGGGQGQASSDPPAKGVTTVVAKHTRFSPAAIEVPAGTEVTWSFQDGPVPHNVEGDGWESGDPQRSGTFRRTFDQPGTYDYACTLHPQMTGRVVVTAKP